MRRLKELFRDQAILQEGRDSFIIKGYHEPLKRRQRVHILAMGDVGGTLALGMKLLGSDVVEKIGICDLNEDMCRRYEAELNQISLPDDHDCLPFVEIVSPEDLFKCDAFIFCATKGVPPVEATKGDMRMMQLKGNLELIRSFGKRAAEENFGGDFFVVSDPVDPLCKQVLLQGVHRTRIKGYGLGVMSARAAYFARQHEELQDYLSYGRAFGPHGEDLVICDNIYLYDQQRSLKLTEMTVKANLAIREMGFKPYIAPAFSSGVLSILSDMRGDWHYSSAYFGKDQTGAFLGMHCRRREDGLEVEDLPLNDRLFDRIARALANLEELL